VPTQQSQKSQSPSPSPSHRIPASYSN
jgi:hypothetical protein